MPQDHPRHVPKRRRGIGVHCKGANGSYFLDHDNLVWVPSHILSILRARAIDPDSRATKILESVLDEDEYCPANVPLDKGLMHIGVADPTL